MNTGKEPFKCGMASAECGERPNLISVIAKHRASGVAAFGRPVEKDKWNEALLGSDIIGVTLIEMPLNVSEGDALLIGGVLNRNQILHGANTDYATPLNSCRAISWLDYVSYLHKLRSKCRNELLQNCEDGCGQ